MVIMISRKVRTHTPEPPLVTETGATLRHEEVDLFKITKIYLINDECHA